MVCLNHLKKTKICSLDLITNRLTDQFKLVNALGEWAFEAKQIPGSINISNMRDARNMLDPNDDIVIHCSNPSHASQV